MNHAYMAISGIFLFFAFVCSLITGPSDKPDTPLTVVLRQCSMIAGFLVMALVFAYWAKP